MPGKKLDRFPNAFESGGQHRAAKRIVNVDDARFLRQVEFGGVCLKDLNIAATIGRANSFEIRLARLTKFFCEIDSDD